MWEEHFTSACPQSGLHPGRTGKRGHRPPTASATGKVSGEAVTPCPSTARQCLGQGCPCRRGGWVMYGPGRRQINTPCQVPCLLGEDAADPSESPQTSVVPASASGLNISAGAPLLRTQNLKNQRWYLCLTFQAPFRQHSAQKALQSSVSVALQAACSCLGPSLVHAHTQTPPVKIYTAYGRVLQRLCPVT